MKATLNQLAMAVAFLQHANADRHVSIADALANVANGRKPRFQTGGDIEESIFGQPRTIFDQERQHLMPGQQTAEEILQGSILRDQIEYWAKREESMKEAWENSNVDFLDDVTAGLKAIIRGPVERTNSQLSAESQVASQDQTTAKNRKREDEEAVDRSKKEEERRRLEEENKKTR